ncbi:MAG: Mu transposase C-terminal domain-containing protein, partial [Desulfovibrionaceae bacterium]
PLAKLTKRQRDAALARLAFVREIERTTPVVGKESAIRNLVKATKDGALAPRLADLVAVANDRMGAGRGLSRRRLYDWCRMFAEGGEAALAPRHPGKDMRVPDWAPAFLAIWQRPQKPTVADAYKEFKDAYKGDIPSIFAVHRFLKKMALSSREAGRCTGNALLKLRPHKHRKTGEMWPGDIYTADGTTLDAEIQHPIHGQPFKPEVTGVIDVATRRCVGISIGENENAFVVLDALRMACLYGGIPCFFYADNGPGYINDLISGEGTGMMDRLDIEMINAIPNRPQGKGLMERAVQTLCVPVAKRFATCSHADMDHDAAHKVFKITRADVKAHGKSKLLPTFEEFKRVLLNEVDRYNARPHRALPFIVDAATGKRRHLTPDEYWNSFKARGFMPLPVPDVYKEELFMPGLPRKVASGWVRLYNGQYFAKELEDFHGDYVEVRYDIWDSSQVYCWTTNGEKICTAKLDGNAIDYLPKAQIEAARERRDTGKIARLVEKVNRVVPGATVQLPDSPATYTMLADSITGPRPEPVVLDLPVARPAEAAPQEPARRPAFGSHNERYIWLMRNRDRWTSKDHAWVAEYVQSARYADLHDYYFYEGIAWEESLTQASAEQQ